MDRMEIELTIARIELMESYLDALSDAGSASVWMDVGLTEMYRRLVEYYEGGQWLRDYELDEKGLLPAGLKRGVLSEDAVYNLLARIESGRMD